MSRTVGIVCSVCKRRPAAYYRRLSGDRLCSRCLERQLSRTIKRTLSKSKALKPKQRVLLWLSPADPWGSATLARILPAIEEAQASETIIAGISAITIRGLNLKLERPPINVEAYGHDPDINTCIRVDRGLSRIIAEELGINTVILPYTRDTLTIAAVDAVTRGPWAVSEAAEKLEAGRITFVSGMAGIEAEAAAAYSFLYRIEPTVRVRCTTPVKRIVYSIAPGRPELLYSSTRTSQLFLDAARGMLGSSMAQCRICGGYTSDSGGICHACRRLSIVTSQHKAT